MKIPQYWTPSIGVHISHPNRLPGYFHIISTKLSSFTVSHPAWLLCAAARSAGGVAVFVRRFTPLSAVILEEPALQQTPRVVLSKMLHKMVRLHHKDDRQQ